MCMVQFLITYTAGWRESGLPGYVFWLIHAAFFNNEIHQKVCGAAEGNCYGMCHLSSTICEGGHPERSEARAPLAAEQDQNLSIYGWLNSNSRCKESSTVGSGETCRVGKVGSDHLKTKEEQVTVCEGRFFY